MPTGRRGDPPHMRRVDFLERRYGEVRVLGILRSSHQTWFSGIMLVVEGGKIRQAEQNYRRR